MENIGIMLDCSRNAVMRIAKLKQFVDLLKKMGYTYVLLYLEDTYEVEGQPYFGYMRGRYSLQELSELDRYVTSKGMELIPCIQTLAHLGIFRWKEYAEIHDCNDILLCGNDKTYALIEDMFRSLAKTFSSRRIHIGMDEAHFMGLGKFLDENGFQDRNDIFVRHLQRVASIADQCGLKSMMWSDMFFRLVNHGQYYNHDLTVAEEIKEKVPKNVELVYWDYYHTEQQFYDEMLKTHLQFGNPVSFAGGAWTWTGFTPHNAFAIRSSATALKACNEHGISSAFITLWGDNGKECSFYCALPALMCFAEFAKGNFEMTTIKARFESIVGINFDDYMNVDLLDAGFEKENEITNPSKYLLYNDSFTGLLDSTVPEGMAQYYKRCSMQLKGFAQNQRYGYIFENLYRLSKVLEIKCDLGIRTRKLYLMNDLQGLKKLADRDYKILIKCLKEFYRAFEFLWDRENKSFGFEIQDVRLGGLIQRTEHQRHVLSAYITGEIKKIDELEEEQLDFDGKVQFSREQVCANYWAHIISGNVV